jgi:methyl-accepting chemotaxis protein
MLGLFKIIDRSHEEEIMKMSLDFSVRTKLLAVFAVILLGLVISGIQVRAKMIELGKAKQDQKNLFEELDTLKKMMKMFADLNLIGMDIIVDYFESPNEQVKREQEFLDLKNRTLELRELWAGRLKTAENKDVRGALSELDKMINAVQGLIDVINRGEKEGVVYAKFDEQIDGAKTAGSEHIQILSRQAEEEFASTQERMNQIFQNVSVVLLMSFVGSFIFLLFVATPIILVLGRNMTELYHRLSEIVLSLQNHSSLLADTSRHLADSASKTTETIHESVSSMTEMSAMLAQTSRNAHATAELSRHVLDQSQEGVHVMEDMSASMKSITDSSARLKEIVQVIDNISAKTNVINDVVFKTQLLAVNASIEAARAGHHGKGFSVVANEVASLAALSGKASAEIRELLHNSSARVQEIIGGTSSSIHDGERASQRSSSAFNTIAKSVSGISDKVEQITIASREQEVSVSQNSTAMGQMNRVASATNEMAQRNAHLGQEVHDLARNLKMIERALQVIATGHEESQNRRKGKMARSRVERILTGTDERSEKDEHHEESEEFPLKRSA